MENKNKDLEDLLTKYKPSGLDESFNHKINSIFSKNSDKDLAPSENKIIPFPFIQKIATVAAIIIAFIGSFFAFLNDSNNNSKSTTSTATNPSPKKDNNQFIPVRAENIFEGLAEDQIILSQDKIPYQGLRYQFSDSFIWKNKDDGTIIEMKVPSQRLYYVPIKTD